MTGNALDCRSCGTRLPSPFLDLGNQPLANNLLSKPSESYPVFPLALVCCSNPECRLVQLNYSVDPDLLFKHYLYVPSTSATFRAHFHEMAEELSGRFALGYESLVVDIGSNDGLLLGYFQEVAKCRVLGVEPAANVAAQAVAKGIPTLCRYLDDEAANHIIETRGRADLITATNVLAHCEDADSFLSCIHALLSDEGVFVVEVPYLVDMLEQGTIDLVYHEHQRYFAATSLYFLFEKNDLDIISAQRVPIHGGSLRVFAQRSELGNRSPDKSLDVLRREERTFRSERDRLALQVAEDRDAFLRDLFRSELPTAGYGAPAKATVWLNYCGLNVDTIRYIVDDNPLKVGKVIPGTGIPVVPFSHLSVDPVERIVIFPWNLVRELERKLGPGYQIIVPHQGVRV